MRLEYDRIVREKKASISFKIDDLTKEVVVPRSQICSVVLEQNWIDIGFRFAHYNGLLRFTRPIQDKSRGATIWIRFLKYQEKSKATRFWMEDGAKIHVPNKHIISITGYRAEISTPWAIFDRLTYYEETT